MFYSERGIKIPTCIVNVDNNKMKINITCNYISDADILIVLNTHAQGDDEVYSTNKLPNIYSVEIGLDNERR
jgi:hypothetical protein